MIKHTQIENYGWIELEIPIIGFRYAAIRRRAILEQKQPEFNAEHLRDLREWLTEWINREA